MSQSLHLILGASGGIGAALTRMLTERGDQVLAVGRDSGRLQSLSEATGCEVLTADARAPEQVAGAVERAAAIATEHGLVWRGAACLVGSIVLKPAHSTTPEDLHEVIQQNLVPAFNLVRAAAPALGRLEGGAIVLMSSAAAQIGLSNHEAIGAAKAAVEGLARSAAATYATRGVRVNTVAPGLVRTPLAARITESPSALAASEAMHPLGRIGEPEEVARALAWLLGSDATWVTGQSIGLDGGLARVAVSPRPQRARASAT